MLAVDYIKLNDDLKIRMALVFAADDRLISKTKLSCLSTRTLNNEMFSVGYMISFTEKEEDLSLFLDF